MRLLRLTSFAALAALFALTPQVSAQDIVFDDFTSLNADGNPANAFAFAGGADGSGAGFGTADGQDGAANSALSIGINPGAGGGFAGGGTSGPEALVDISGSMYMTFYFNPGTVGASNVPLTLEINLQEDAAGAAGFQADVDDEFQAVYTVTPGTGWQLIAIPLASFTDDNTAGVGSDDGFDFSKLATVVFAFGGLQGDEFAIQFDDIAFASNARLATSSESLPEVFATAPSVFPNPTAGRATVAFELAQASDVSVDVLDLLGRRVAQVAQETRTAGPVRLGVPTEGLAAGLYIVRVRTEQGVASTRLVVTR